MGLAELEPMSGPYAADRIAGAGLCLGDYGVATRQLADDGFVTPDLQVGFCLHLLAGQPRPPTSKTGKPAAEKASSIAGGVWVREMVTFHRPIRGDDAFRVTGELSRRFIKKQRRYTTNLAQTHDSAGHLVAENCTTGLVGYQPDPTLVDGGEGPAEADLETPGVAYDRAADNPSLAAVAALVEGETLTASPQLVTLELMQVRDGAHSANPIHTDPEEAAKSGLAAPIAGGSHVLSYALELLLGRLGPHALSYGSHLDVRWFTPTFAGTAVTPTARVRSVDSDAVTVDLEVDGDDGPRMKGTITIPTGSPS